MESSELLKSGNSELSKESDSDSEKDTFKKVLDLESFSEEVSAPNEAEFDEELHGEVKVPRFAIEDDPSIVPD